MPDLLPGALRSPTREARVGRAGKAFLSGLALALAGCATWNPPPPRAAERAAAAHVYSGSLRVSVRGPDVRGRSSLLVAFRRPGSVRLEIPGSAGARLIAVVRDARLTAVFPRHRAVLEGTATAADFDALLGVALDPEELMDMLVGVGPPRMKSFRVGWGERLPALLLLAALLFIGFWPRALSTPLNSTLTAMFPPATTLEVSGR